MSGITSNLVSIDNTGNTPIPFIFGDEYIIFPKYFYRSRYEGFR